MSRIVLASSNAGKLKEFQQLLAGKNISVIAQSELNIDDADETGLSFVENAIIKARHAAQASGLPAIADDSGLEVDALDGAPGIYSARFSGPQATDAKNNALLLEKLADTLESQRTARFQCLLVYLRHANDPTPIICQGTWEGRIAFSAKGDNGFGYDPLFFVPETNCHSAELDKVIKNKLSHRGKAIQLLLEKLG